MGEAIFELIFTVEVLSVIITILAVTVKHFWDKEKVEDIIDKYQKEFQVSGKILRIIGEEYDIGEIEILLKALEESGKLEDFTGDIEEGLKEELKEVKKE